MNDKVSIIKYETVKIDCILARYSYNPFQIVPAFLLPCCLLSWRENDKCFSTDVLLFDNSSEMSALYRIVSTNLHCL